MDSVVLLLITYQILVALLATFYKAKLDNTYKYYILGYFWFTGLKELFAFWYGHNVNKNNLFLYNFYQVIEISLICFIFYATQQKKTFKIISIGIYLFYLSSYFYMFFTQKIDNLYDYSYTIGSICLVLIILLYFYETLNNNQIFSLNKSFIFWFGAGIFVYHLPSIPFTLLIKYYADSSFAPKIFIANFVLIFLSNSTFIYGLLCAKPNQK